MTDLTMNYTQLKTLISKALGGVEVKPATLSRWMRLLGYPKGQPGRRRLWDLEDAIALSSLGVAYSLNYQGQDAIDYAVNQVEKYRQWHSIPTNLSDPTSPEPSHSKASSPVTVCALK